MMLTRGSKFFFALALAGYVGAIVYGVLTNGAVGGVVSTLSGDGVVNSVLGPLSLGYKGGVGDQLGYSLFMGFAVCSLAMGFVSTAFRDGDPAAIAELSNSASVPPVAEPNDLSVWPIVAAFATTLLTLGLATNPVLFVIGAATLVVAAIEWTIKDWSERATGDPEVNRLIRNRLMYPVELPIASVVIIAITVFSFSRILITSSKTGAVIVAGIVGALIFGAGALIAARPQVRRGAVVGAVVVGAIITIALGVFGAIQGEHPLEHEGGEESHASAVPADHAVPADYSVGSIVGETE